MAAAAPDHSGAGRSSAKRGPVLHTELDVVMPSWHWRSRATTWVDADPACVFLAFEQTSLSELPGAAAVRRRQARGDRSGLTVLHDLLDQGFVLLGEVPDREVVLGRIGQFWQAGPTAAVGVDGRRAFLAFDEPGYAKAAFSVRVEPLGPTPPGHGTMAVVESRLVATDQHTRREFNRYWLVGSWANPAGRSQLLAAVRRRATDTGRDA